MQLQLDGTLPSLSTLLCLEPLMSLQVGDRVMKVTGDYRLGGVVVARFKTLRGKLRFVVEHSPGFLHIYSRKNLRLSRKAP